MWPPTQEVSMLQSASNWTFIGGEVLFNKILCHPGLRGFDLLSESTCDRMYVWKTTGSAMPSAHNSGSQKCFALAWMLSPHRGPWSRSTQMKEDMTMASGIHFSCSPYLERAGAWLLPLHTSWHNCNRNEPSLRGKPGPPASSQCSYIVVVMHCWHFYSK